MRHSPCFVCEYTLRGHEYRCFVSGTSGQLVGVTHDLSGRDEQSIFGGAVGALCGFLGHVYGMPSHPAALDQGGLTWEAAALVAVKVAIGSLVGAVVGQWSRGPLEEWRMAEHHRKLSAARSQQQASSERRPTPEEEVASQVLRQRLEFGAYASFGLFLLLFSSAQRRAEEAKRKAQAQLAEERQRAAAVEKELRLLRGLPE